MIGRILTKIIMMPEYVIEDYKREYLDQVLDIADAEFGKGYVSSDKLQASDLIIVVVRTKQEIIGFSILRVVSKEDLCASWPTVQVEEGQIGKVQTIAVKQGFKRSGVGSALFEASIQMLRKSGVSHFFIEAWRKSDQKVHIESVALKYGFRKIAEVAEFWYQDSLNKGYQCKECGHPCHCSAVAYMLSLSRMAD